MIQINEINSTTRYRIYQLMTSYGKHVHITVVLSLNDVISVKHISYNDLFQRALTVILSLVLISFGTWDCIP